MEHLVSQYHSVAVLDVLIPAVFTTGRLPKANVWHVKAPTLCIMEPVTQNLVTFMVVVFALLGNQLLFVFHVIKD